MYHSVSCNREWRTQPNCGTVGHLEIVLSKDRWSKEPASVPKKNKGSWSAWGHSKASSATCKSHHQSLWNEPPRFLERGHAEVEFLWPAYKQKTDLETVFGLWTTSVPLKSPSTSPSHIAAVASAATGGFCSSLSVAGTCWTAAHSEWGPMCHQGAHDSVDQGSSNSLSCFWDPAL